MKKKINQKFETYFHIENGGVSINFVLSNLSKNWKKIPTIKIKAHHFISTTHEMILYTNPKSFFKLRDNLIDFCEKIKDFDFNSTYIPIAEIKEKINKKSKG